PEDGHEHDLVSDLIEHAMVSDADPPCVLEAGELPDPVRPWIVLEHGDSRQDAPPDLRLQLAHLFRRGRRELDAVLRHGSSARSSSSETRPPSSAAFAARNSSLSRAASSSSRSSKSSGLIITAASLPCRVIPIRS